jgi:glycosyltransferase involved in cell wall biosynthesis
MEPLLVSILIPVKNTAHFLTECLESVLQQDYEAWEVLAVDDHSTDGSYALVESFTLRDHRIRLLRNDGDGIIHALRVAYANSSGRLITRMDSDDIMPACKINAMAKDLQRHGPGHLALGKVKYFSFRGISDGYARYERWLNRLTETGNNFSEIYKECPVASPCWMVFREDLDNAGAFLPDRYPEDYDLCFRFYETGLKCLPSKQVLHYWRDYDTRTSRTHPHYSQNYFLDIKLYYFLRLERIPGKTLAIWGAGFKGKAIARQLTDGGHEFVWFCDNPNKVGKKIYGTTLLHFSELAAYPGAQSIITVANAGAQNEIRAFLGSLGQKPMRDYYFFC